MITNLADTERSILGLEHNGIVMAPEEFDAVEDFDDNYDYELVHGVLIVNPIPSAEETGPNEYLGHQLLRYRENHPQGSALDFTLPEQYVRTPDGRRRADRLIWAGLGRMPTIRVDVPAIAIEFVSSGKKSFTRDYVEKRQEYLALGMAEYWIIDRFRRFMTVYRGEPQASSEIVVKESQTYETPLLPGFQIVLAELLTLADQIAQAQ
jgi:Uma2 family endonuclease